MSSRSNRQSAGACMLAARQRLPLGDPRLAERLIADDEVGDSPNQIIVGTLTQPHLLHLAVGGQALWILDAGLACRSAPAPAPAREPRAPRAATESHPGTCRPAPPTDTQVVEQRQAIACRVPVGEGLAIELGLAEPRSSQVMTLNSPARASSWAANISRSIRKPCERTTTGPSPPLSSKRMRCPFISANDIDPDPLDSELLASLTFRARSGVGCEGTRLRCLRAMSIEIVELATSRLGEMKELWRGLYEHHTLTLPDLRDREIPFEQAWQKRREIERRWLAFEPQSFVFAAGEGERTVGYAYVRIRSAAGCVSSWKVSDPLAELSILAVAAERRGEGIGSILLDAVEQRLSQIGIEDMLIGVIATNEDAMRLYERRGARPFLTDFIQRVRQAES